MRRVLAPFIALAALAVTHVGCNRRVFEQVEPTCDVTIASDIDIPDEKASDILIVVDNSGSMQEEQTRLAAAFINDTAACPIGKNDLKDFARCEDEPDLAVCFFRNPSPDMLAAPAPDGLRDCGFIQVLSAFENDFRIGVITTDIGLCDNRIPAGQADLFCGPGKAGENFAECGTFDGIDWGFRPQRGCLQPNGPPGTPLKVIARQDLVDDVTSNDEIGQRFIDTLKNIRVFGSSVERGLDAMQIFLNPASDRAPGCEDDLGKFLRKEAKLIVIFLSDEEDCSRLPDVQDCKGLRCADCDIAAQPEGCEIFECVQTAAEVNGVGAGAGPFALAGLRIHYVSEIDGVETEGNFTFTGGPFEDMVQVAAAVRPIAVGTINIPGVTALVNDGQLRLQSTTTGRLQAITVKADGTANALLGFSIVTDTFDRGSDEEDCVNGRTEFFDEVCGKFDDDFFSANPAGRCYDNVANLTPPARYVDFLKGLKNKASDVSVAVISGGVLGAAAGDITPAGCTFDSANGQVPLGTCNLSRGNSNGQDCAIPGANCCFADPGSRYFDVASGMNGLKDSICVDSFAQTMIKIAVFIADVDFLTLAEAPSNPALVFVEKAAAGSEKFASVARIDGTECGAANGWVLADAVTVRFCGDARPGPGERIRVRAKGNSADPDGGAKACVGHGG